MKHLFILSLCLTFAFASSPVVEGASKKSVNLILDTDLGPDYDDVGAMAVLHALADSGQVHILATLSSNHHEAVVPCIEVLNTYFGRAGIPVGAPKSEGGANQTENHKIKWTEVLPAKYPHRTLRSSDAPDAVKVYRKLLSHAPNKSVTICTIGFFTNLRDLLASGPDEYSRLSGKQLVAKKVKRLVSMAGAFPSGREYNVYSEASAGATVINEWPTEILFSGFEIGEKIRTGSTVATMDVDNSPVKEVFKLCLAEDGMEGRMSWDQTAVLVAIKGYEPYYTVERGQCTVAADGSNTWKAGKEGTHLRLIQKMEIAEITEVIENLMRHQPSR